MTDRYVSAEAICPFYKHEDLRHQKICCEGIEKGSTTHVVFGDSKKQKRYRIQHCNSSYKQCRLYAMLMGKYEEDANK